MRFSNSNKEKHVEFCKAYAKILKDFLSPVKILKLDMVQGKLYIQSFVYSRREDLRLDDGNW